MQLLKKVVHDAISNKNILPSHPECFTRIATRAIVIRDQKILLMYTKRYNDYSLPGGGVDQNELIEDGFKRELNEETGACNIHNIQAFGLYEEYRPYKSDKHYIDCNIMHMLSYCYTCDIAEQLAPMKLEDYEVKNGMQASWVNIDDAITHNIKTIKNDVKQGLSVERETYLLKLIKRKLLSENITVL